jgi:hypothetical protein
MLIFGNSRLSLDNSDLPCLIHGAPGSGASFFSINVIAESFYLQGLKILFFTAKPAAREEFLKLTGMDDAYIVTDETSMLNSLNKQAVFVNSGDQDLFVRCAEALPDMDDRVIFVKNIELYEEKVFSAISDKTSLILSGDIDTAVCKDMLIQRKYVTKIFFSKPEADMGVVIPDIEKYKGYMDGRRKGVVALR